MNYGTTSSVEDHYRICLKGTIGSVQSSDLQQHLRRVQSSDLQQHHEKTYRVQICNSA